MKRVALLFILAVLVPSVLLALLAARSLRDQQFVLERQQSLLYQGVTDSFAKDINDYLADQQREFNSQVESLMAGADARTAAAGFDERLRQRWPLAEVGFCVTLSGSLLCPSPASRPETRTFCVDNGGFLANRESVEVYWNDFSKGNNLNYSGKVAQQFETNQLAQNQAEQSPAQSLNPGNTKLQARKVSPVQQAGQSVAGNLQNQDQNLSKVMAAEAEFHQLVGDATDGVMARFLQNKLKLMFWHRLEKDPQLVFGAQLDLAQIKGMLQAMMAAKAQASSEYRTSAKGVSGRPSLQNELATSWGGLGSAASTLPEEICVAILDDNTTPIAVSNPRVEMYRRFEPSINQTSRVVRVKAASAVDTAPVVLKDLKRPFVSTEIGEALPHWEVAAYLMNPDAIKQTAQTVRLTLGLLIASLLIAMVVGSWLIVNDLNRQVTLARQKTDFVSNVSHELKTPLTSIRMFSELLAEGRVGDAAKQRSYLHIITAETARLTRLINNVLDFARLERGEKKYNFQDCDLRRIVRETADSYQPHLENNNFTLDCHFSAEPLNVRGDCDALAQVIVNLLSNAEKYSDGRKQIEIRTGRHESPLPYAEVKVLDRGVGVPGGCEDKIFEKFYRAHDSLSSGIQGSGLGLTLARQIARAHGGDVAYEPREGGGSCFALRLPLHNEPATSDRTP